MNPWTVEELQKMNWFRSLMSQIQEELEALNADRHDMRPALEKEKDQLGEDIQGWSLSLAKPNLSSSVRETVEKNLEKALERQNEIEHQLVEMDAMRRRAQDIVDPQRVVDQLNRLAEVMAAQNPTRTNLELSLHIDNIRCFQDGRVVVRTCKLGALAGSTAIFAEKSAVVSPVVGDPNAIAARPRRRSVRRVTDGGEHHAQLQAAAHAAADVNRFAGLSEEWFWEDVFEIPEASCWSRDHAEDVGRMRETGMTHEKLAEHFDVTPPTIRKALEIWQTAHPEAKAMPRKMPRRRWEDEHAQEVLRLRSEHSVSHLAKLFGKSEETIRKAIRLARNQN